MRRFLQLASKCMKTGLVSHHWPSSQSARSARTPQRSSGAPPVPRTSWRIDTRPVGWAIVSSSDQSAASNTHSRGPNVNGRSRRTAVSASSRKPLSLRRSDHVDSRGETHSRLANVSRLIAKATKKNGSVSLWNEMPLARIAVSSLWWESCHIE